MTVLLVAFAVVPWSLIVLYLVARSARQVVARLRRRPPERVEECTCGVELPVSKAHIVAATFADADEIALGGMTAVTAAFCRAHCPGGCNHPKEHR